MPTVTIRLIDVKGSNVSRRCQYGESVAYESDNRRRTHTRRLACAGALLLVCSSIRTADPDGFESAFDVKRADFASVGKNDYFILDQGISLSSKVKRAARPLAWSTRMGSRNLRTSAFAEAYKALVNIADRILR
jgi:hypothetical protein